MSAPAANGEHSHVRVLPLAYDKADSEASSLKLILTLAPHWAGKDGKGDGRIEFVRFKDGITNTLLKAVCHLPGLSKADMDRDAILLRAYGNCTAILIDREREAANHELLMKYNLAPALLARFKNGMLYRYVPGVPAQAHDLQEPDVLRAVARRLAQWHATVPCLPDHEPVVNGANGCQKDHDAAEANDRTHAIIANAAPGKAAPNVWMTMQKWILALPTGTEAERERQALLQKEFEMLTKRLSSRPGLGRGGLVFAHCDLLCANVIMHRDAGKETTVSFIDYEYGTPSPAAFDIANHFAEWVGLDCDYSAVPTRCQREAFIRQYVSTYKELSDGEIQDEEEQVRKLMHEVDVFRGVPGFYWGVWALIQAMISEISFDYATYAELRLGEYWAWKAEEDGSRAAAGKELPLRERTWARTD